MFYGIVRSVNLYVDTGMCSPLTTPSRELCRECPAIPISSLPQIPAGHFVGSHSDQAAPMSGPHRGPKLGGCLRTSQTRSPNGEKARGNGDLIDAIAHTHVMRTPSHHPKRLA